MDDKNPRRGPLARGPSRPRTGGFRRERRGTTDECPRRDRFSRASRVTRLVSRGRARARAGGRRTRSRRTSAAIGATASDAATFDMRTYVERELTERERVEVMRRPRVDFTSILDVVRPIVEAVEAAGGRRRSRVHAEVRRGGIGRDDGARGGFAGTGVGG